MSETSSGEDTTPTPPPPDPSTSAGESSSDDGSEDSASNFIDDPDPGGETFECSTWVQDCPAGQKCVFWANDGGNSWNATKCETIPPNPDEVGESCTVEGSGVSGIDSCGLGAICWDVDPETHEGTCIAMCLGDESNPICDDPETFCVGRGPYLCLPTCCPVQQDCPEGQGCYPINETFSCAPDASMDGGAYGDTCEFINVCDPGLACLNPAVNPGCDPAGLGCCVPLCDLGVESCELLNPETSCIPWYEEQHTPIGYEHIGFCAAPW